MRVPWFTIRALAAMVVVPAAAIVSGAYIANAVLARLNSSLPGRVARKMQTIEPDVKRRDQEVEELTGP